MTPLDARIARPGPRRLLALDGGGIRGVVTIEVLAELERVLRQETGAGASFRLADYFDYIAGTSTGAIIASCLSLGMSADEIREFYISSGPAMFVKSSLLDRAHHFYRDEPLAEKLQAIFDGYLPAEERSRGYGHVTLGSSAVRTLLLVVMRNATTDSPWPVSNNPRARYNDRRLKDCNLDFPLWQLARASAAAPTFFPPEEIAVGDRRFLFVDGGVTTYNNPAFLLFLMSTLPAYRLEWPVGEDKMLLVSLGTGSAPNVKETLQEKEMWLKYNITAVPRALLYAALNEQDMLCRALGRCRAGGMLDTELGTMIDEGTEAGVLPKLFTYVRYNGELTRTGLDALGLPNIVPENVMHLDSIEHVDDLQQVGRAIASSQVRAEHFRGFTAPAVDAGRGA